MSPSRVVSGSSAESLSGDSIATITARPSRQDAKVLTHPCRNLWEPTVCVRGVALVRTSLLRGRRRRCPRGRAEGPGSRLSGLSMSGCQLLRCRLVAEVVPCGH